MPDVSPNYADSCGTCYEVQCNPSTFTDGYGQQLDRNSACRDSGASLVFRVTDTCPCVYPSNAYSNKRWCCGDMPHLDLSIWGFEKLADTSNGVIGIRFRRVPCDYKPEKVASPIANPTQGEQPPSGAKRTEIRPWEELSKTETAIAYDGSFQSGFWDGSYNVQGEWNMRGVSTGQAKCGNVQPKGAHVFKTSQGSFKDHIAVSFMIYMDTKTSIEKGVVVVIGGQNGDCAAVDLTEIKATAFQPTCTDCNTYWWKFEVYMSAFAGYGPSSVINNSDYFLGCGGNSPEQLEYVEVRNYRDNAEPMCVDRVQLK
ncbi:hypothetical protein HYH03_010458 [Edaphochlamys debaryana]|uniref:Expansin-like EG45 domain-containing protein n=1 Tax=Edaphochlamys debaryana TaxID=47281 RepID=A0A835XW27_9CHLO|nr:hypothetical protein HYH03_010458 [Edaphochlamys debaryana]|eukprot:KAG2491251.1 hypothetical protein HYH03_010458 [Edaphochlamys debaryana]